MMGSFRRPRFMSSPVLSDLARFHASSPALQLSNASIWNSVQSAVIKVFQEGGLQTNELYSLNESIRSWVLLQEYVVYFEIPHFYIVDGVDQWLQRTELGSFITEYFQDQLLNKGLAHILEKIQLYQDENCLKALSEVWVTFFTEILPTLQAIFYPLQGQELTVRQMALLGFRDHVLLKLPLETMVHTGTFPSAFIQMLLILQGIHEPSGPSKEYYLLEKLIDMVISPYLSNYLYISHRNSSLECCVKHPKSTTVPYFGQPEITVTHFAAESLLTPLVEQEGEAYLERTSAMRRHTVASVHTDIQLFSITNRTDNIASGKVTIAKNGSTSPFSCQLVNMDPQSSASES